MFENINVKLKWKVKKEIAAMICKSNEDMFEQKVAADVAAAKKLCEHEERMWRLNHGRTGE